MRIGYQGRISHREELQNMARPRCMLFTPITVLGVLVLFTGSVAELWDCRLSVVVANWAAHFIAVHFAIA